MVIDPNICQSDPNDSVVNTYTYRPFGEDFTSEVDENVCNSFKFTGQWYDAEIAQYCLRARQYDPAMMRFTSRDPVKGKYIKPLTLHQYLYCGNDSINRVDWNGRVWGYAELLMSSAMGSKLRKEDYKFHKDVQERVSNYINAFSLVNLQRGLTMELMVADIDFGLKKRLRDGGIDILGEFEDFSRISSYLGYASSYTAEVRLFGLQVECLFSPAHP